jgi:hypothetical protein
MPQAAAAWAALGATAIGQVIQVLIINIALSVVAKQLAKGIGPNGRPPVNVTVRGTVENRRIIFGERRAGGFFAYYNASSTSGSTKDFLWYVIVYTGHQVNAIKDIWIDTIRIANADINATTGVVSGSTRFAGKMWIWKHLGTSGQTVDTNLDTVFTEITSAFRFQGCSYIVVKMKRDADAYPTGSPQNVTAQVEGALLYDPRLDSTNGGSGSHRSSNPTTWAYSTNPALAARWYLTGGSVINDVATRLIMYGLKEPDGRINDSYFRAGANVCDESISGVNAPPSGAQKRYECNGEFTTGESRRETLTSILDTCAGELVNVNGKWRFYAGDYDTPLHTLTQDDLYGDIESDDTSEHRERWNQTAALYFDKATDYQEATTIYRTDSSYEAQDGGEAIAKEISLRAVIDVYQAQRLAEIENRKSRMQRKVTIRGALNLLKVAPYETFTLSHSRLGWSSRVFRCVEREFDLSQEAGRVVLKAEQEDPAVWTDMLTADYDTGTSSTDEFLEDGPEQPLALTVTPVREGVVLRWDVGTYWRLNGLVEIWESTSTTFGSALLLDTVAASSDGFFRLLVFAEPRYYWIRARSPRGQVSTQYPSGTGISGVPLSSYEDVFLDTFDHQDYQRFYNDRIGPVPVVTYPANGDNGGRVLRVQNYGWFAWKQNIPYDPNSLYRMTARVRIVQAATNGQDYVYMGVEGVAADGVTLINAASGANSPSSQHYAGAVGVAMLGTYGLNNWATFVGYFSGLSGSPSGGSISDPYELFTGVKFIRPLVIVNYASGDGIMEVDYIRLDKVVNTDQLAPNSATAIAQVTRSSISLTGPVSGFSTWDLVCTLALPTFIDPVDVVITATGSLDTQGGTLGWGVVARIFETDPNGTPFPGYIVSNDDMIGGAKSQQSQNSWSREISITIPASTSKTYYLYASRAVSGGSTYSTLSNVLMKAEIIKR